VKKFPAFYGTRRFINVFLGREVVSPSPTTYVDDHPLSAVHDCFRTFNISNPSEEIGGEEILMGTKRTIYR
jgi:hypothetical protein